MAYTMEDIRKSQEIFYYLLEKHELREEDEQALYKAYTEEEDIQNQQRQIKTIIWHSLLF